MTAASEIYEVVLYDINASTGWRRTFIGRLFSRADRSADPGGVIISVRHIESGFEVFRHIEDGGDDDHLRAQIQHDLASMTAADFDVAWG